MTKLIFSIVGLLILSIFLEGCVTSKTMMPLGENKYLLEADSTFKTMAEDALKKMAEEKCSGYKLENVTESYDPWGDNWEIKWIILCP